MMKPTTGVVGEPPQIWLGWPAPPHMVDGGGLRQRHWCLAEASGSSNVCERNNPVFCSYIFFLQFSFNDNVSNSKWIAQNPCFVQ
jgi:hypothetical protein